ncbi:hypothetical protein QE177_01630 [Arsenophonus sp. aPb]|uniref:hypothetical protein n=1 Tax=Arsenophonus sp. aPb TaxID=3041619 RepID=UPI0024696A75|nr:hypothetical protein [Arsenophonus sp. aPb]WGL98635.1 hypothetical protein QE177_01630 [Arsenophonus sp. aPb]
MSLFMLPKYGEVYQSHKTGRKVYTLGYKHLTDKKAVSHYEVCLVDSQTQLYSEIPLAWFQVIYKKTAETIQFDDINILFRYACPLPSSARDEKYGHYL